MGQSLPSDSEFAIWTSGNGVGKFLCANTAGDFVIRGWRATNRRGLAQLFSMFEGHSVVWSFSKMVSEVQRRSCCEFRPLAHL